ncbi:hypothetical protein KFU94_59585 [Chloroflexi bacterium TSY]|nr:hypothetical protein [Chloroflexi bacterium TSY]MBV7329700.1 hypothetical protein [Chloroflexi bacterium TSY]MBV7335455.1 hypothetical protein [Chloroflexi bacterium TSY]MBV7338074.1 hypothetical protein [Chloroflexi bacterium TSY]
MDSHLLTDPAFRGLDEAFKTKITIASELVEKAVERTLIFGWALFDGWYLAPDLLAVLDRLNKDWISILKCNRNLETNSFRLRDEDGQPITFEGPHIKVKELVPYIPPECLQTCHH